MNSTTKATASSLHVPLDGQGVLRISAQPPSEGESTSSPSGCTGPVHDTATATTYGTRNTSRQEESTSSSAEINGLVHDNTTQPRQSFDTLQPFEHPPYGQGSIRGNQRNQPTQNRRGRNLRGRTGRAKRNLLPHEEYQENQRKMTEMFSNKYYKSFYIIKAKSGENLAAIDTRRANRQILSKLGGRPKSVNEVTDGNLIVEVHNEYQGQQIQQINKLADVEVEVTPHPTLNQVKGTIYYRNPREYTTDEIMDDINENKNDNYKVTDVYRIKRKRDGLLEDTPIFILTFEASTLPDDIYLTWLKCPVREYIPRPRRCFKCQRYGHGNKQCRSLESICVSCGQPEHGTPCDNEVKCANCNEAHKASSTECFYHALEQEALTLQTREKIRYTEAKRKATKNLTSHSYAKVLAASKPQNPVIPPREQRREREERRLNKEFEKSENERKAAEEAATNAVASAVDTSQANRQENTQHSKDLVKTKESHKILDKNPIRTIISDRTQQQQRHAETAENKERKRRPPEEEDLPTSSDRLSKQAKVHGNMDTDAGPPAPNPPDLNPRTRRTSVPGGGVGGPGGSRSGSVNRAKFENKENVNRKK